MFNCKMQICTKFQYILLLIITIYLKIHPIRMGVIDQLELVYNLLFLHMI